MNVYDSIIKGLSEAVDYENGSLKARSNRISVEPVKTFKAEEIKNIRNGMGMTQVLFAGCIGVSPKTVEAWESGRNVPDGPARRMLSMFEKDPSLPEKYNFITR